MSHLNRLQYEFQRNFIFLKETWNDAHLQWRDRQSIQFEKEYWSSFENETVSYINNLKPLVDILERAEYEVKK